MYIYENRYTHFMFTRKLYCLWDNVEKCCRAGRATDENMTHAHCMLYTSSYKHTLRICNNHCFSSTGCNERALVVLRYTHIACLVNTLWTGDAELRLYITTVQDGWRKSAFLTRALFPRTTHLITQYMEHFSEWSCWRMFIETRVFDEYFLKISVHKSS